MRTLRVGLALAFFLLPPTLARATCTLSADSLNFGAYDVFATNPTDSTATLTLSCDTATAYSLTLSAGGSGEADARRMANLGEPGHSLGYGLYKDATYTNFWNDSDQIVTGNHPGDGSVVQRTVYGRIPARQNARIGTYSDTIVVTVVY